MIAGGDFWRRTRGRRRTMPSLIQQVVNFLRYYYLANAQTRLNPRNTWIKTSSGDGSNVRQNVFAFQILSSFLRNIEFKLDRLSTIHQ
ncbi:MAG: hypothetical protein ACI9HK_002994, partial [Pirellulaceae bacterium]